MTGQLRGWDMRVLTCQLDHPVLQQTATYVLRDTLVRVKGERTDILRVTHEAAWRGGRRVRHGATGCEGRMRR